jgi:nucleotide-binding universal stress UspA family protein
MGLKTQIGLLDSAGMWMDAGLIIVVACLGKFGGTALAARACGLQWRESSALGILMNTRGLMELVILQIGSELNVITPRVFAMMVMMAIATTCFTTPVLSWVYPRRLFETDEAADSAATGGPTAPRPFSVLIPVAFPRSGGPLLHLASLVTGADQGRIVALHLRRPMDREGYRAGFDDPTRAADDESLEPLIVRAKETNIKVEPVSFATVDVPGDIAQVADEKRSNLVLIGFHNPVFGHALLGGTVAGVMRETERDVAVFIDRGFNGAKKLLIPFLGTVHDRLALELAGRIARSSGATITLLHVVAPGQPALPQQTAAKIFGDPSLPEPVEVRTVESDTPVSAVLSVAGEFNLVVIGVAERWGLESRLFGLRAERIARDCPSSLLIVRKYVKPGN